MDDVPQNAMLFFEQHPESYPYKQMLDAYKKYGLMDEPIGLGSEKRMVEL